MIAGQVTMVVIMTMTPLHMADHGHDLASVGFVISAHTAGMFALAPVSGRLTGIVGPLNAILIGAGILALAGVLAAVAPPDGGLVLTLALFLLGYGWNLGFVAGSSLIAARTAADRPDPHRGRRRLARVGELRGREPRVGRRARDRRLLGARDHRRGAARPAGRRRPRPAPTASAPRAPSDATRLDSATRHKACRSTRGRGRMTIRAGIVGLGFMGRRYAETLAQLQGVTVTAVTDARPPTRRRGGADRSAPASVPDGVALAQDATVDAVFVCTPEDAHADIAVAALDAGKHLLIEKPVTHDLASARAHRGRGRRAGTTVDGRPHPPLRAALGGRRAAHRGGAHRRRHQHRDAPRRQPRRPGRPPRPDVDPALLRRPRPRHRALVRRSRAGALDPGRPPRAACCARRATTSTTSTAPILTLRGRHHRDGGARLAHPARRRSSAPSSGITVVGTAAGCASSRARRGSRSYVGRPIGTCRPRGRRQLLARGARPDDGRARQRARAFPRLHPDGRDARS